MKTIRLLYPDWISGGLETYHFGANLLQHILPVNPNQLLVKVDIPAPDGRQREIQDGIAGKDEVLAGIRAAQATIEKEAPQRIITIGGNCLVSQAPFDYLHGLYPNTGILWLDAHPDVSMPKDGYPNAHAMVLGALLGAGEPSMTGLMKNPTFKPDELLYVGLQGLHDYQAKFLNDLALTTKCRRKTSFLTTTSERLCKSSIMSSCIWISTYLILSASTPPISRIRILSETVQEADA